MEQQKEFLHLIDKDRIKINWNKNPIEMEVFLSFLTVKTVQQHNFLGSDTGWTQYKGENGLVVGGGVVNGKHYLDSLKYGKNLDNPYNNYINPFYLFDIMTDKGKVFFVKYYEDEIRAILNKAKEHEYFCKKKLEIAKSDREKTNLFWRKLSA